MLWPAIRSVAAVVVAALYYVLPKALLDTMVDAAVGLLQTLLTSEHGTTWQAVLFEASGVIYFSVEFYLVGGVRIL